ncbi:MAG TPA: hypothetical protein VHT51_15010 [Micropepsaceae bacterium]|nr:hypothetical protein [Micropepsaceae bacterium]
MPGRWPLKWQYIALIALGFALAALCGGVRNYTSICEPEPSNVQSAEKSEEIKDKQQPAEGSQIGAAEAVTDAVYGSSTYVKADGKQIISWACELRIGDLGLIFFTYCLVVVGWATMRSAENTARAVERSWVIVQGVSAKALIELSPPGKPIIEVLLVNAGKGPAILKAILGGGLANTAEIDPNRIPLAEMPIDDVIGAALPPGETYTIHAGLKQEVEAKAHKMIVEGKANFVLRTVLVYEDGFGDRHETAYCIRYNPQSKIFVGYGGKKHNYTI